jgi:holo-[acyl-carrier protein] synthase
MIFGIGTDVVQLPAELTAFRRYKRPVRFLAMRFAAKEAIVKAMGTGFAHGMWIRDSGVVSNAWGKPEIIWSERGRGMCEKLGIGEGHVTLTDEAGLIVAVAVLMRKPG